MKRHTSLDEPPDHPFFRGYKKADSSKSANDQCTSNSTHVSTAICSILIKQLDKCVGILEKGGLSQAEYAKLQQCILKDIRDTK